MTNPRAAKEALGQRLREIRRSAGLTGRALAGLAGWHESKVSKIEYGKQTPTESDLRTWCDHADAAAQLPDLIATLHNVEAAYLEVRRMRVPQWQRVIGKMEADAELIRWFEPGLVPGLLQTSRYIHGVLKTVEALYGGPDVIEASVAARLQRQQVLYKGRHRFHFIIGEQALWSVVGDAEVMVEQLDRLLTAMTLPRVVLGIVPLRAPYRVPLMNFAIFDRAMVQAETISAQLTVTQPREIGLYERAFNAVSEQAAIGNAARELITAAMSLYRQQLDNGLPG
ncbi:Scr1 family TA system antitoxin-like transcriptional regulator [Nocardia sp. R7R-8]|uniref:Scr1 family TA system antitoxin-like transcriptional regulator n=1 Tax=Nocardia sp. R7R-8 TaxID=3459304 RepID=UPI00403D6205